MWNFTKLDTTPLNSPLSLFSAPCHPQTVKYRNENPLSCHPLPLKLLPTCENIGLQSHLGSRNSQAHSSAPHPHQICTPGDIPATPIATPPMRPQALPSHAHSHTPSHTPDSPPDAPLPPHPHSPLTPATHLTCTSPPKFACNSRTGVTQQHKVIRTSRLVRGNCMRNCST